MTRHTEIAQSTPSIGEGGHTGDWRSSRPVIEASACLAVKQGKIACQICWVYCPDVCIAQGVPPSIDLDYCKGCGICAQVCPAGAIAMQPEAVHSVCQAGISPAKA